TEEANRQAPYADAISTTVVNVADFSQIKVNGSFQVQIFGTYGHNSVYVYGPNAGVSNVAVSVNGDKLSIRQKDPNVPLN
ncbi:hypothetical protein NL529_33295, partial [Klebsiella pneumoniae]|nr:hypothetical protein [Klebsiella pneumoniae]